jgi:hypothetical protein
MLCENCRQKIASRCQRLKQVPISSQWYPTMHSSTQILTAMDAACASTSNVSLPTVKIGPPRGCFGNFITPHTDVWIDLGTRPSVDSVEEKHWVGVVSFDGLTDISLCAFHNRKLTTRSLTVHIATNLLPTWTHLRHQLTTVHMIVSILQTVSRNSRKEIMRVLCWRR